MTTMLAELDVLMLSRVQFALTVMFHYLFPPLTIGLGLVMVGIEGAWLATGQQLYKDAARFWTRIFALNFAMGVATGIVMEFQFGTNWATYSRFVGDVFGSALAAEAIFAFFLESGFLALLVFGWDRIGPRFHFFSTLMVFLGSAFSAVWIVVANSWQQTPTGHEIRDYTVNGVVYQRAEVVDFWAMVFNPSSVDRLTHVYLGAFILGSFFVMSVSAWYILKGRHLEFARRSFKFALVIATLASLGALVQGHAQTQRMAKHQPAKLAAFEGHYANTVGDDGSIEPAPLTLFGIPDPDGESVKGAVRVPGMLSFLVHDDFETPVAALQDIPEDERPPTVIPFITWRLMVGLGMAFIGVTLLACFYWWRGTLFEKRWLLWIFVIGVVGPYIANQAGWIGAEVGRQPWIVSPVVDPDTGEVIQQGLRTEDAVSKTASGGEVLGAMALFGLIYTSLFIVWIVVMHSKIVHGPPGSHPHDDESAQESAHGESIIDVASSRVDRSEHMTEGGES